MLNNQKKILIVFAVTAFAAFGILMLLVSIFRHKTEAQNPYLRFVEVKQGTTDPAPWGLNWPREFDQYKRTSEASRTNFGGGDANPAQKSIIFPFLTRMFAGYAFSIDYRDRRGHAYMLLDQEKTKRVTDRPQPGACLHCHASLLPTIVRLGGGDPAADSGSAGWNEKIMSDGFIKLAKLSYWEANAEIRKTGSLNPIPGRPTHFAQNEGAHPISCTDCHNAKTMKLEINRPGFVAGIREYKASQGIKAFDVNRDATRTEMRTYVCAQCHVEYYCGPKTTLFFPWNNGMKVEQIETYYDNYKFSEGHRFFDWQHAETGAELLKAQHPEFEMWSQGVHARSGVTCVDCHMPYGRNGAMKVSDHYIRSPLLMVNHSCQQCHNWDENELKDRVKSVQDRNFALLQRAGQALLDFLDEFKPIRAPFDAANKGLAIQQAKDKLDKDTAYAALSETEKMQKMEFEAKVALTALWAKYVAKTPALHSIAELQRKGQWRLDFVAAENSMGFHAPQESARILGEAIDYFRQAQLEANRVLTSKSNLSIQNFKNGRGDGQSVTP